jgi:predicted nucleic acid-binding protein
LDEASSHVFAAPHLFPLEMRNALLMLEWKGRLTYAEVQGAIARLMAYGIAIESPPNQAENEDILELAWREHLTAYDALYLWHAMRGDFALASRDSDLLAAAVRTGVQIRDVRT